jgi:hypothetical protein
MGSVAPPPAAAPAAAPPASEPPIVDPVWPDPIDDAEPDEHGARADEVQ